MGINFFMVKPPAASAAQPDPKGLAFSALTAVQLLSQVYQLLAELDLNND